MLAKFHPNRRFTFPWTSLSDFDRSDKMLQIKVQLYSYITVPLLRILHMQLKTRQNCSEFLKKLDALKRTKSTGFNLNPVPESKNFKIFMEASFDMKMLFWVIKWF
jgi:hypothetical protein